MKLAMNAHYYKNDFTLTSSVGQRMPLINAPLHPAEGSITCSCGLPLTSAPCFNKDNNKKNTTKIHAVHAKKICWKENYKDTWKKVFISEYVPKKTELSTDIPMNEEDAPRYNPLIYMQN
jgi:hypothetical protein